MKKIFTFILVVIMLLMLVVTVAPGLFSLSVPRALAHVEGNALEDFSIETTIVEPDLFIAEQETPIFLEVRDRASGEAITELALKVFIENDAGNVLAEINAEPKGARYFFEYVFPESGTYVIRALVPYESRESEFEFEVFATEPENRNAVPLFIFIVGGALILLALGFGVARKKIKAALIFSLIIAVAAVLGFSLYQTFKSGAAESGLVTCVSEGTCFWTAHIHTYVPISICGEDYRLPIETGPLDGPHTHEEKNIAHWHDKLPYDPATKNLTETAPLTLGAFFDALDIPFGPDRIHEKKNGDLCPDGPGKLMMFVDGTRTELFRDYVWNNREVIMIFFDAQTPDAIETMIKQNPVTFPALGRG